MNGSKRFLSSKMIEISTHKKKFSNCKHFVQRKPKHQLLGNWEEKRTRKKLQNKGRCESKKLKIQPNTPFPQIRPPNSPKPLYKTDRSNPFSSSAKIPKKKHHHKTLQTHQVIIKQDSNNCIIKSHPKFHISATRPSIVQQFLQKQIKNHQIRPTIINVSGHMLISNEWIYFQVSMFQKQIGLWNHNRKWYKYIQSRLMPMRPGEYARETDTHPTINVSRAI